MNKFLLAGITLSLSFVAGSAIAKAKTDTRKPASVTRHLTGVAAEEFVTRHFPNADIPGPVEGKFAYVSGRKNGFAKCDIPAMGEASDGVQSTCVVTEGKKTQTLSGPAAEEFVEKHFPNADIPGTVQGKFVYAPSAKRTGYAKCNVPAMGEASDGVEATCDVTYN